MNRPDQGGNARRAEYEMKAISRFGNLMLEKLAENRDKAHWDGCDTDWLMERLTEEVTELHDAIEEYIDAASNEKGTVAQVAEAARAVRRECADVANFAMMIADNLEAESHG